MGRTPQAGMIARTSISVRGPGLKVNEVYLRRTSIGVAWLSNGCLLFVSFCLSTAVRTVDAPIGGLIRGCIAYRQQCY